jgi:hypothetical protein
MHGMLRRAAASAIPALVGLAVSPASTMAAPHTGQAAAGPVKGGREVHERLVQRPLSGTIQGHTAKTTGDTYRSNDTDAESAAIPAIPAILAFLPAFTAIPIYPSGTARLARFSRVPVSENVGGPAFGIIATGKNDKIIGNRANASAGSGKTIYRNVSGGETGSVGSFGPTGSVSHNGGNIYRGVSGP